MIRTTNNLTKILEEKTNILNNATIKYDDKGNIIYIGYEDGYEQWYEYNERGNETHYKTSTGFERWREYNEMGGPDTLQRFNLIRTLY